MRVVVHGPAAGALPNGTIGSWGVDEVIDVDDTDEDLVAHWTSAANGPLADIIEEAAKPAKVKAKAPKPTGDDGATDVIEPATEETAGEEPA